MPANYYLQSYDAQRALTEFALEFFEALAIAEAGSWAKELGLYHSMGGGALQAVFPIPISAAGFVERTGNDQLRDLYSRSLQLTTKEYSDGVAALAKIIESNNFMGWLQEPQNIAREAARQPNIMVAAMLEANPLLDFYRVPHPGGATASTVNLFHDAHPVNPLDLTLGTFDNLIASGSYTAINSTLIKAIRLHFATLKGPNGKPMGLRLTDLIVPPAREEEARDFFERDMLIEAVTNVAGSENVAAVGMKNRYAGTVRIHVADEFTSANVIYPLARNRPTYPWVVVDTGTPEEITYDKTSELYKDTGKVGKKFVIDTGVAGALPHGIMSVDLG